MSSAPFGWTTPRTDWVAGNIPTAADFNRAETNSAAIDTGARTVDQALAGIANVGTLRQLLSWYAQQIRAITGRTNWHEPPATTLANVRREAILWAMIYGQ